MNTIEITINGKKNSIAADATLLSLMKEMKISPEKTVAMINDIVVKPSEYAAAILKNADKIELMSFVGGG
ncbi:MAG: thiamine biosynthesis protein ThiS [Lentisphaerae bacterium GWF2_44_16]|nr:MAG: thiamine biosynthesis protein ThiS [Lentisphaerae bacterium GWF2_44_16]